MKQKITTLLLAVSFLFPARAYDFSAANEDGVTIYYNLVSATDRTVEVAQSDNYSYVGMITIPETTTYGGMEFTVTTIGSYASYCCSSLIGVKLPPTIVEIKNAAFSNCTLLESIYIPDGVTVIGNGAFNECLKLQGVRLPQGNVTLGRNCFGECSNLKEIYLPSGVQPAASSIFSYTYLEKIYIEDLKKFVETDYGFYLHSPFDLYLNETKVVNMVVPDGCTTFEELGPCKSLKTIVLPNECTTIRASGLKGCENLQQISLGSGLTEISPYGLEKCSALEKIFCRSTTPPSVSSTELADINKVTCKLYVPEGSVDAYRAADGWGEFLFVEGYDFSQDNGIGTGVSTEDEEMESTPGRDLPGLGNVSNNHVYCYYDNSETKWSTVYIYYWNTNGTSSSAPYPGTACHYVGNDLWIYEWNLSRPGDYLLFNGGMGNWWTKSDDIAWVNGGVYGNDGVLLGTLPFPGESGVPSLYDPIEDLDLYLRGGMNDWDLDEAYKFSTEDGVVYTLELEELGADTPFVIANSDYSVSFCGVQNMSANTRYFLPADDRYGNCSAASNLRNLTISFIPGCASFGSFKIAGNEEGSGVETIETPQAEDGPAEYYDLQGRRLRGPIQGIYLERRGSVVTKRIIKP